MMKIIKTIGTEKREGSKKREEEERRVRLDKREKGQA